MNTGGPARRWAWVALPLLLALAATGCGRAPAPPADTGSREAVQGFYDSLIRQDWQRAYAALDRQDANRRLTEQEFARRAEAHRRGLGFAPEAARVQSCQENGPDAIAHVVLTGHVGAKQKRYKDAVTLRRGADGWRIVLPDTFGRTAR
jgi:hypothetical protein